MPVDVSSSADSVSKPTGVVTPADALGVTKRMSQSEPDGKESFECSKCGDEFNSPSALGGHVVNSHHRKERVKVECEWCGEEYEEKPHREDRTRFCSRECQGASHANESSERNRIKISCSHCGEEFETHPYRVDKSDRLFCPDSDCRAKWMSENQLGENHPGWKGGYTSYSHGWEKARKKALERDGYCCQDCGLSQSTHKEKHSQELHVHHIQPIVKYDNKRKANKLDNLVTLCRDCHWYKWERMSPLRPDVRTEPAD